MAGPYKPNPQASNATETSRELIECLMDRALCMPYESYKGMRCRRVDAEADRQQPDGRAELN